MCKKFSYFVVTALVFLISTSLSYSQCAMCKAVAESNSEAGGGVADGLNVGIMYLMAFPYLMAGIVGILWYRHNKRTKPVEG